MSDDFDGLLLIDKPSGPTSHDVVDWARRWTGERRVGHAGTLDPLATGLLPVVIGRATRLVRFLPGSPKTYTGTLEIGWTSATDDVTGPPVERHRGELPDGRVLLSAAREFEGRIEQTPPAYSARKVDGQRLYHLARQGVAVKAPAKEVSISRWTIEPTDSPERFDFVVEVSAGTYVRSLVRDLGERLGCGAVLAALRRTSVGPLKLTDAVAPGPDGTPPERHLLERAHVPLAQMPLGPPPYRLGDSDQVRVFLHGGSIIVEPDGPGEGLVRVLDSSGALLGVAEIRAGRIQPRVVVASQEPPQSVGDPG